MSLTLQRVSITETLTSILQMQRANACILEIRVSQDRVFRDNMKKVNKYKNDRK